MATKAEPPVLCSSDLPVQQGAPPLSGHGGHSCHSRIGLYIYICIIVSTRLLRQRVALGGGKEINGHLGRLSLNSWELG